VPAGVVFTLEFPGWLAGDVCFALNCACIVIALGLPDLDAVYIFMT
jgi:hypothetical protein